MPRLANIERIQASEILTFEHQKRKSGHLHYKNQEFLPSFVNKTTD